MQIGGEAVPVLRLSGTPGDGGVTLGRFAQELFRHDGPVRGAYLNDLHQATGVAPEVVRRQASLWLAALPVWAQEQIDGLAIGSGAQVGQVAEFLYADIATSLGGANSIEVPGGADARAGLTLTDHGADGPAASFADGAMCTGVIAPVEGRPWVARNCDWLLATLRRGTAAVVHEVPGRIPVLSLGILGDIDVDTGVNAERLWLHLHTLPSLDRPRPGRARFSWLFWAREALETCATIDEVEAFIERTDRDRGVLVLVVEGKTGKSALFECGRSSYERVEPGGEPHGIAGTIIATNHPQRRHPSAEVLAGRGPARSGSTIQRYERARSVLAEGGPGSAPHDLMELLSDPEIEMHSPRHLRTIYSVVCGPGQREIYFAPGCFHTGRAAPSVGRWTRIAWPWR